MNKYTPEQIQAFYEWNVNDSTTRHDLILWIMQILPKDDVLAMIEDAKECNQ